MDKVLKTMIDNMPEKTGKSLAEWKKILKEKAFAKHGESLKFLKGRYGVSHGFANTIIMLYKEQDLSFEDLVGNQYEGKKSLVPIYEKLVQLMKTFGSDVTITPKKTSVSIIRKRQFALIKPATKTRIDLGLKLPGKEISGRLEGSGPFGTMCTHRVQLTDIADIDEELSAWLLEAYGLSN